MFLNDYASFAPNIAYLSISQEQFHISQLYIEIIAQPLRKFFAEIKKLLFPCSTTWHCLFVFMICSGNVESRTDEMTANTSQI